MTIGTKIMWALIIGVWVLIGWTRWQYDVRDIGGGLLQSRAYGVYPAVVPCEQGMTLYPHQRCTLMLMEQP